MKKTFLIAAAILAGSAFSAGMPASDKATAPQAEAMVRKAVAFIKANGKADALAAINGQQAQFKDRDLYLTVYQLDGLALAHGANIKMVGHNFIDFKDVDGKEFFRERMELARAKSSFWQDYKFTNPTTRKIEPKSMYCERVDEIVVCGGIYKGS